MRVCIHRHSDCAVSELVLNVGKRFALLNEQRRVGMSEIMF